MNEADRTGEAAHPRTVYRLIGHQAAEAALARAIAGPRLHHAWLISGPRGVGKATLAYRFVRRLLGAAPDGAAPLGASANDPVCRAVEALSHPDFVLVRRPWEEGAAKPKSDIPAEAARALAGFFHLKAAGGGRRVALIDSADELNRTGANALLKTLEEPPPGGVIVILAHTAASVPATIRSRCRRLDLRPLSAEETVQALAARPVGDTALRLAAGSPGRALELQDSDAEHLYRLVSAALAAAPDAPVAAGMALARAAGGGETAFALAGELIADWLARAARAGAGEPVEEIEPGESALMARYAALAGGERLVEAWEETGRIARQTEELNLDRGASILAMLRAVERAAAPERAA